MTPSYQAYPLVLQWYPPFNYDYAATMPNTAILSAVDNGTIVLSAPYMLPDPENPIQVEETDLWAEFFADYISPEDDPYEPISEYYFPVFDSDLSTVKIDPDTSSVGKFILCSCCLTLPYSPKPAAASSLRPSRVSASQWPS